MYGHDTISMLWGMMSYCEKLTGEDLSRYLSYKNDSVVRKTYIAPESETKLTRFKVFTFPWLGILVVRASDLRLNGCEFDSRPPHYRPVGTGMGDRFLAGIPPR